MLFGSKFGGLVDVQLLLLDALGVKNKVIFVRHSTGGVVASEIAATKGDRISVRDVGPPLPSPR